MLKNDLEHCKTLIGIFVYFRNLLEINVTELEINTAAIASDQQKLNFRIREGNFKIEIILKEWNYNVAKHCWYFCHRVNSTLTTD